MRWGMQEMIAATGTEAKQMVRDFLETKADRDS